MGPRRDSRRAVKKQCRTKREEEWKRAKIWEKKDGRRWVITVTKRAVQAWFIQAYSVLRERSNQVKWEKTSALGVLELLSCDGISGSGSISCMESGRTDESIMGSCSSWRSGQRATGRTRSLRKNIHVMKAAWSERLRSLLASAKSSVNTDLGKCALGKGL